MALMTVTGPKGPPTLAEAAAQLGVAVEDLNASFGVVPIDLDKGLYSVEVRDDRAPPSTEGPYRGPFSNPKIEPFGPIKKDDSE